MFEPIIKKKKYIYIYIYILVIKSLTILLTHLEQAVVLFHS